MASQSVILCPDCSSELVDTRVAVQPYNDFDDYAGFRCSACGKTFLDEEVFAIRKVADSEGK